MKDVNYLVSNGVNVEKSLELFGDMEMYDATLNDFVEDVEKRIDSLKKFRETGDMQNYAIEVHALKSDARYLGFTTLADLSYESELKSKAGDIMFVQENHPKIMAEAKKMVDIAKQYLGLAPVQSVAAAPAAQPTEQVQPQPAPVEQPVEAAPTPVEQPAAPVAPVETQVVAQPQPVAPVAPVETQVVAQPQPAAPVAPQPVQDPMAQAIVNQGMAPEAQPVVPAPVTQPVSAPAMPVQQEVPPVAPVEPQVVAQPQPVAPQPVAPQPQVVQQAPVAAPVEAPAQPTVQFFPADNQPAQPTVQFFPADNQPAQPTVQFFPAGNQAQQPVAQPGMAPAVDGQKQGTILIVDDSNLVVNFVKTIFDSRYNVIIASDGAKAIELLDQEDVRKDIKACLLDLNMPNVDGYAVLEHCKQKGYFVRMPVAVESGVEDMASIDRVNAYPIVDILSKPFNERDVQRVIEKCLATYF